ncbi:MAG TPA: GNAT family N-acetyltransferase [Pirellulales bacterium]|nr:GNAT family N-acetyltransferase [Pirellulales bacterium]
MADFKLIQLRSAADLRAAAPHWDELWYRSDVSAPTARAELIAQWIDQFAPRAAFRGLAIEHGGNFVAALPLVAGGVRPFRIGNLPANAWGLCGDLLSDPQANLQDALQPLAEGLSRLSWPLLRLAPVAYASRRWQLLLPELRQCSMTWHVTPIGEVGQVAVQANWDEYQSSWSGNHRRHLRKARKRAERAGSLTLEIHREFLPGQVERLFRLACEIEDQSWKGRAGTSIMRSPGMFDWHLRQAQRLADWGQLQLSFLRHEGKTIACEYGYRAKGTYYSAKVGYDPAYAHFSPGQLLRAMLLERFHNDGETARVDFWGPLTSATAKWSTQTYPVGRIAIAPNRTASRLMLAGVAACERFRVRGQVAHPESIIAGAPRKPAPMPLARAEP